MPRKASKSVKSNNSNKKKGLFGRFFSNKKYVAIGVFVFVFVAAGGYTYYKNSSAATGKTVDDCASTLKPTLRQGSSGSCVNALQHYLNKYKGYNFPAGNAWPWIDPKYGENYGYFGSITKNAVIAYQYSKGGRIAVDGIVGGQTWGVIRADCGLAGLGGATGTGYYPNQPDPLDCYTTRY